jgi:three-Cys-motif partner protein
VKRHTRLGVEENFFSSPRESSRRKLQIISDYFVAYNRVMVRGSQLKVGYADLFSGPGLFDNGEKSVPVIIAERTIADEHFRQKVHLWFNDGDPSLANRLERAIRAVPGINTLRYAPTITKFVIDKNFATKLRKLSVPTLVFADPCGYKGLSLQLVTSALKGFGNDCIFFFNYNRVNMKLSYPVMDGSIDEFFERDRAASLRSEIRGLSPAKREERVLDAIRLAIQDQGGVPLVFKFRTREGGGTSHHLVFASKGAKGIAIMKRIMNQASSSISDGVGSWDFDPRDDGSVLSLFSPLEEVRNRLLSAFAGREVSFRQIIAEELRRTNYTESNYRDALLELEKAGQVKVSPISDKRRWHEAGVKRTLPLGTKIVFS